MNKLERWKFLMPLTLAVLFVAAMVGGAWANEFAAYVNDFAAMDATGEDVTTPVTVVDDSGNTYLVYEEDTNNDIKVQKVSSGGSALWDTTNAEVADNNGNGLLALDATDTGQNMANPKIAYCGSGKIAVVAKAADKSLWLQVIDGASGNLVLPTSETGQAARQKGIKLTTNGATAIELGTATDPFAIAWDGSALVVVWESTTSPSVISIGRYSITNGGPTYTPVAFLDSGHLNSDVDSLAIKIVDGRTVLAAALQADTINSGATTGASVYINRASSTGSLSWAATAGRKVMDDIGAAADNDKFQALKLVGDGADGLVIVGECLAAGVNPTIAAIRIKSGDLSGSGTDMSGSQVPILAAAANNQLHSAFFINGSTNDAVGIVYDDGTTSTLATRTLATTSNLGAKYTLDFQTDNTKSAASVAVDGTHFVIQTVDSADDVNLYYIAEAAGGASASSTWSQNLFTGTATIPAITNVGGYLYSRYVDTPRQYVVKWHHTAGYDLNLQNGQDLQAVLPSPFEVDASGGTITVSDRAINEGDEASPATTVTYFLTNGVDMDAATLIYELGTRSVAVLNPGVTESSTPQTELTIPDVSVHNVTGNNRYIIAVVNYTAYANEVTGQIDAANKLLDNSSTALGITINQGNVRPRAATMTVSPTQGLTPGAGLTITDTTENNGAGSVVETKNKYYLTGALSGYTWNNIPSLGVLLGERTVPSMVSGGMSNDSTALTLPSTWEFSGTKLRVQKLEDADNAAVESDENDNYTADNAATLAEEDDTNSAVDITVRLPNLGGLTVGNVRESSIVPAPGTYKAGDSINVVFTVANSNTDVMDDNGDGDVGDVVDGMDEGDTDNSGNTPGERDFGAMGNWATSGNVTVAFYWGPDIDATGGGGTPTSIVSVKAQCQLIGTVNITSTINSGATYTGNIDVTVPDAGGDRLYMVIDPDNVVLEGCENDNIVEEQMQVVQKPDLIPSGVTVSPTVADQGALLTVPFSIRNVGPVQANPSIVGMYMSADTEYDAADVFVGVAPVKQLGAVGGAASSVTYTGDDAPVVTIPTSLPNGTYYVLVRANYDDGISESTTANNLAYGAIPVTVGAIADLTATPSAVTLTVEDAPATVTIAGGSSPYTIQTAPNGDVATATIDGSILTITVVAEGDTSLVIVDNQVPADSVTITITVGAGGGPVNPPTETNVGLCDAACQATAPVTATGVDFSYTEGVTILVGAMDATFTQVWWLNSSCEYTTDYAEAASGETALSCSVDAPDDAAWLFWFVTAEDLATLDWENGAYELLFYELN